MSLNERSEVVSLSKQHFVFVEKIGPFHETAQMAWKELHSKATEIAHQVSLEGFMSLYQIEPEMIYRAGVTVNEKPPTLPPGLQYLELSGGRYDCYTLTGSYSQLPEACGRVFELIEEKETDLRADFFIENYVNDPSTTPADQLVTKILVPLNF